MTPGAPSPGEGRGSHLRITEDHSDGDVFVEEAVASPTASHTRAPAPDISPDGRMRSATYRFLCTQTIAMISQGPSYPQISGIWIRCAAGLLRFPATSAFMGRPRSGAERMYIFAYASVINHTTHYWHTDSHPPSRRLCRQSRSRNSILRLSHTSIPPLYSPAPCGM